MTYGVDPTDRLPVFTSMVRRRVLQLLAAFPLVMSRRARARSPELGRVYDGELVPSLGRDGVRTDGLAPRGLTFVAAHSGERVALRRALRTRIRRIDAMTNANDRYLIELGMLDKPKGEPWLIDNNGLAIRYRAGSEHAVYFEIDRQLADALAAQGQVERRDRTPHGDGILAHWRARRLTVKLGDPIEIEVEIVNRGNRPATLAFGPLASSFAFAVRGVSAQTPVFTGPLGIRTLPPGGAFSLSADLRSFVRLDHTGEYDVACTLNLEALEGETYPMHPSARWDLPLQDTLHIRVL